jgi:zinc transporter ZupT
VPDLLLVTLVSTAAALAGAFGIIPVLIRGAVSPRLGWANALAAGIMLGVGYLLLRQGIELGPTAGVVGATLGIALVWASHWATHMEAVDLSDPVMVKGAPVRDLLIREGIHSAAEGVAIGVGFVIDPVLGLLLVGTIGLHNMAEGAALSAAFMARGAGPSSAAALSAAAMLTHVPAAVGAAAFIAGNGRSWGLGFAAGTMLYLVFVELAPESYRQRGHTGIAITASAAMSIVVLLGVLLTGG